MTPPIPDQPPNQNPGEIVPLAVSLSRNCNPTMCLEDLLAQVLREVLATNDNAADAPSTPIHSLAPLFERHECVMVLIPQEMVGELTVQCGKMHLVCERLDQLVGAHNNCDPDKQSPPTFSDNPSIASDQKAMGLSPSGLVGASDGEARKQVPPPASQKPDNTAD
jgi:hypothetical protein